MKISTLVTAYKERLCALQLEQSDLSSRIERLTDRGVGDTNGRLATKLGHYKYRLNALETQLSDGSYWLSSVATPIHSIIQKHVGPDFRSALTQDAKTSASIRICHSSTGSSKSLILDIQRGLDDPHDIRIIRTLTLDASPVAQEVLPLEMSIFEIPHPLLAA